MTTTDMAFKRLECGRWKAYVYQPSPSHVNSPIQELWETSCIETTQARAEKMLQAFLVVLHRHHSSGKLCFCSEANTLEEMSALANSR